MGKELIHWPMWAEYAFRELLFGVSEIAGPEHNARVLQYFIATDLKPFDGDETSWCAAGANFVLMMAAVEGTGKANARSFCDWGVPLDEPKRGALLPLWRVSRDDWRGHIGILTGWSESHAYLLGANQGNTWSIKAFPWDRSLGPRWPTVEMRYA